jgi:hypothetical protein
MPIDINGYALSNNAGLALGASASRILAANYGIKDPTLPGMLGSCTDGSAAYKCYPFPINDVNLNNGSPWSVSTFMFTAPVAGIYYTSYSGICGNGTGTSPHEAGYHGLIVNGANQYFSYHDDYNTWDLHHIEMMFRLQANDNVRWAMNISPAPDNGGSGGSYRANHNTSTIWLVG